MPRQHKFEEIQVGDSGQVTKTVTETDVILYAGITGDNNPVHINEIEAKASRFGQRLVHGMLTAGFISAVLGTCLPGKGAIYMGQTLKFLRPVHIGDTVTAIAEVIAKNEDKRQITMRTTVVNQDGKMVIDGEALAFLPAE
ncbi:MAG: MaoC family dehydratase [Negativicutes bacterium]|jgi:3-hydroxybutyryl-CoA dehydratase|nr:MaoC family dehydratase [Negativicutes bacterium]